MASSIPKFASFRPKPKPGPPAETPKGARHVEKERLPEKEQVRSRDKSPSCPKQASSIKDFFSDRRGDPEVLRYGILNSYDIPAYRRYGHGSILGLSSREKIDREYSTDKKIYTTSTTRQRRERLLTRKSAKNSRDRDLRFIKVDQEQADVDQDFISLPGSGKRKSLDSDSDRDETAQVLDYRGVEGKRDFNDAIDPDTQYESDTYTSKLESEATRKNSELSRTTKEHPHDLQGWLTLIDHQEDMLRLDRPSTKLNVSDKASLADVRTAIYEEALKKIGSEKSSVEALYKGLMAEAQKTWNITKLTEKWKDILSKHPQCLDLWFMYLDFEQSNFSRFKFEECRMSYFRCLKSLQSSRDGNDVEIALHLLLRLTSMIHEAGYQELSLAIWQAILEFHLMRPTTSNSSNTEDHLQSFEAFWESEVPRIGEPKAKGWRNATSDEEPPPEISFTKDSVEDDSDTSTSRFRRLEIIAIEELRYPGRSSHTAGEDDAFHIIFFSDIESYIKILPFGTPAPLIMDAFLCFCGLPDLARTTSHQPAWRTDPFLQRTFSSNTPFTEGASKFWKSLTRYSGCPIKGFQMNSRLLFEQDFSLERSRLSADFLRRILKMVALGEPGDDEIREYLLSFELFHFPDQGHKTAKTLLKAHPSSLRLYNAYALLECRRGNFVKADQVFSMALSIQNSGALLATTESLELFCNWIWTGLQRGELTEALWRLVSPDGRIAERSTLEARPEEGSLLHIRTILSETSERALLKHDYSLAILSTSLLALLNYVTNDQDITAALATHQNLSSWFTSHKLSESPFAEANAQSASHLLSFHATHAPIVKPALIRTTLSPMISQFPDNTLLLALFAANEARFAIDDRVRSIMHQNTLQASDATSVVRWAFAIHHETLRGEIAGSTSHSIRALYKRATESTGAHCPAIWKAYFQFELAQLEEELRKRPQEKHSKSGKKSKRETRVDEAKQRAKDVFYAGVRNLPWCKDFMMMAFTEAIELFSEEEMWRVYMVLQEKELRLYTELDEKDAPFT